MQAADDLAAPAPGGGAAGSDSRAATSSALERLVGIGVLDRREAHSGGTLTGSVQEARRRRRKWPPAVTSSGAQRSSDARWLLCWRQQVAGAEECRVSVRSEDGRKGIDLALLC